MNVTCEDLGRVLPTNVRVGRGEFGAVWAAAERRCVELAEQGAADDWYPAGVAVTCRWLACAVVEDQRGYRERAYSPVTGRVTRGYEELIDAEFLAAERLDLAQPDLVVHRPGWCEGIRATLRWAWRRSGPPPLPVDGTDIAVA